ncbi:MAG: WD40 repeat domain-containing serine/threonine-protein kinase [Chloroflexaceae bacterium]|nr:WD40 repeat domain-containing serine/threonine-protein kinase [Chloroflexaceae bacterium]
MAPPAVICPTCGHANPSGSRFCNACGARVAPTIPVTSPTDGAAATRSGVAGASQAGLPRGAAIDPQGRYIVERAIGKGGFAEAYLVNDRQLNRFAVAKRHSPNPAWSARTREFAARNFAREAELLVTLNTPGHPNIPEIYEYLPEQGVLVMKYVEGRDLSQIVRERDGVLPPEIALPIVRDVAAALAYMHSRRPEPVLHRDVKPSNIIIDSAGRVWLIDFGLSRVAPVQPDLNSQHTQLAGTLGFTPPEQWRGQAEPRSDVYALAATLHTILTGHQPTLTRAELPDFLRGAINPFPPVRSLNPSLHPDVAALIARGLAFRPEDRPSAAELVAALERLISPPKRSPLQAPDGTSIPDEHALALWAENHWEQAVTWLYGALPDQVTQLWGRNKLAADMRAIVTRNPTDPDAALDELLAMLDPADFGAAPPRLVADRRVVNYGTLGLDERRAEWVVLSNAGRRLLRLEIETPRWALPAQPALSLRPGQQYRFKVTADMRRLSDGGRLQGTLLLRDRSGVAFRVELQAQLSRWRALWVRGVVGQRPPDWEGGTVRPLRRLDGHRGAVWGLDLSPDGRLLASGGWDGTVRLWRTTDGAQTALLDEQGGNVLSVAFSPDGQFVAATGGSEVVRLWQIRTGRLLRAVGGNRGYFSSVVFGPSGNMLITTGADRVVCLWRASDGALLERIVPEGGALSLAVGPGGHSLAVGCGDGRIRLYDLTRGTVKSLLEGHRGGVIGLAYSRDGTLLLSTSGEGPVLLWDLEAGTLRHRLQGHASSVRTVALHPEGLVAAAGGIDGEIRLWQTVDGALRQVLTGHSSGVVGLAFAPTGALLASSSGDGVITLWKPG